MPILYGARDRTQSFIHSRQALCQWSYILTQGIELVTVNEADP